MKSNILKFWLLLFAIACQIYPVVAQNSGAITWLKSGKAFVQQEEGNIVKFTLPGREKQVVLAKEKLIPNGQATPLAFRSFTFSADEQKILLFTNTRKVWREHTRGDYWVYDLKKQTFTQIGKNQPAASLMFAQFSPDGNQVAYVSLHNMYVEDLSAKTTKPLTSDGTRKIINGTFDWAYEEEFFCRNGFRWSPDSKRIAYWQMDANQVKDYLMVNLIDSVYSQVTPVEYPVAGEAPSPYKIGVVEVTNAKTTWLQLPGDPRQHYVPRLEWTANPNEIILQQLNRKQNESRLFIGQATTGKVNLIYQEKEDAWIDVLALWDPKYANGGWDWLNKGREFLWASEKDGWRHLYRISHDGKKETLITRGNYDVMEIIKVVEPEGMVYFTASPENATQTYLYRTRLDGKGKLERLSPTIQAGTHRYVLSPNGKFARHLFSNYYTPQTSEWLSLPDHKSLDKTSAVTDAVAKADKAKSNLEFLKIKTSEGVEMDAWMLKPANLDKTKKYPVVFNVYTEPWGQIVKDVYGISNNRLYKGNMADDGYVYVGIDNRGTPVPKGREWRKSVYRKIGLVNINDQALAAKEILKMPFIDTARVAVWGWSGGGSATLNLLFQHPKIYKTGIAVAAVGNQLTYDNIYQERYMGLPQENKEDFVKGSPITYAKNLRGNLLYIHGTGDDNVHYNNAEQLINELIKYNKQFQVMPYPNRTHSISEGEGTQEHLSTLYTNYLKQHCPPGGR
ncbi:S9 family peptidase [Adhaeribacter radiodurans]|uniref:S9 family peptidase n=1 Tax=Adhaeribacter radiodurans TaxID=2745197 RepID=A0A7L7L7B6_9BACT|nr:S9 family peptidase [Adhaeribacter radiodurans]QMU28663.1 S9 family peptidase [Adhaeribacter radiodurans]